MGDIPRFVALLQQQKYLIIPAILIHILNVETNQLIAIVLNNDTLTKLQAVASTFKLLLITIRRCQIKMSTNVYRLKTSFDYSITIRRSKHNLISCHTLIYSDGGGSIKYSVRRPWPATISLSPVYSYILLPFDCVISPVHSLIAFQHSHLINNWFVSFVTEVSTLSEI